MRDLNTREQYVNYITYDTRIASKEDFIVSSCTGKRVLDIGCIDHNLETVSSLKNKWMHHQISLVADEITGVDILEEEAAYLNKHGYNIVVADILNLDLRCKFDVIVAGDIIEHISSFDHFFVSLKRHMHQDSIAIITTPNPFNIEQTFLAIFDNRLYVHDQHVAWLDPRVMWELASVCP